VIRCLLAVPLVCLYASVVQAAVEYLPDKNLLWVKDYPEGFPCTPQLLARIDRTFGWGQVVRDPDTETYTVGCGLRIGRNDGSDTYFQVGSDAHPKQTLIVRGDVRVYPTWLVGENPEMPHHGKRALGRVNRLTLGVKGRPSVNARLLIDNRERAGHTLVVGGFSGYTTKTFGGQLCVYNSTIAAPDDALIGAAKRTRPVHCGGQDLLELVNAAVRGVRGRAFGRDFTSGLIENCRFDNCGVAIQGNYQKVLRGCTFTHCGTAVIAGSRNPLVLYDCEFADNKRNWSVPYHRLVAIDCTVDSYDKGGYSTGRGTFFISKRHVVVRVIDQGGKPVKGAAVRAVAPKEPLAGEFDSWHAVTGQDGRTPGAGAKGALLLSEILVRAAEEEGGQPTRETYRYTLTARAGKRTARLEGFAPGPDRAEATLRLAAPGELRLGTPE